MGIIGKKQNDSKDKRVLLIRGRGNYKLTFRFLAENNNWQGWYLQRENVAIGEYSQTK